MAETAAPESRADADGSTSDAADDFEFCIVSSGGLVPAGAVTETDMCVADELFAHGKLLPLRPSSAVATDVTLPRSESAASTTGFGSRSDSRSASSSGSSSGCVSRSQSSKSGGSCSDQGAAPASPRRSLSSSLFYAHPSPSPQLRSARPRRSIGSAAPPPAAWGIFRLGVAGAPEVYPPPRSVAETKNGAKVARGGGSQSARFEHVSVAMDKKLGVFGLSLFADSLGCKCSPDAVEPVRLPEAAKRSRMKGGAKTGQSGRRSRILDWLHDLAITTKEKK